MSRTGARDEEAAQRLDRFDRLGFQLPQQGLYPQVLELLGQRASLLPGNLQFADSLVSGAFCSERGDVGESIAPLRSTPDPQLHHEAERFANDPTPPPGAVTGGGADA